MDQGRMSGKQSIHLENAMISSHFPKKRPHAMDHSPRKLTPFPIPIACPK
jgi:hypothetical protein